METNKKEDFKTSIIFVIYIGLIFIINILNLFLGGGFEEPIYQLKTFMYLTPLVFSIVFMISISLGKLLTNSKFINSIRLYGYDPEYSILSKVKPLKPIMKNILLFTLASILILTPFVVFGLTQQTAMFPTASLPVYKFEQQVTPTSELGLAVEPASSSETLMLWFFVIFVLALTSYFMRNQPKTIKKYVPIIVSFIAGVFFWVGQHIMRYGSSEWGLIAVGLFAVLSLLLIFLTGSVIPAIIYHQLNNLFLKAFELFSNESLLIIIGLVYIGILALFIKLYIYYKDKNNQNVEVLE